MGDFFNPPGRRGADWLVPSLKIGMAAVWLGMARDGGHRHGGRPGALRGHGRPQIDKPQWLEARATWGASHGRDEVYIHIYMYVRIG